MARRTLRRISRRLGGEGVEEAALCARALSSLLGRRPAGERLAGDPTALTRAALTARVLTLRDPVPWPNAVMRQLDPDDAAFLPVVGLHPVLAARERVRLGLPERTPVAHVDPLGWCSIEDGPGVSVWFGEGGQAWTLGRRPDEHASDAPPVVQERCAQGAGLLTRTRRGDLSLSLRHWPVVLDGEVAYAIEAVLELHAGAPRPVRLAFAMRPAGREGTAPMFHLTRDNKARWSVGGLPVLALQRPGDEVLTGTAATADPWHLFAGLVAGEAPLRPGPVDLRCGSGQCSAAEITRATLVPGEPLRRLAIFSPPAGVAASLVRTSARSLWAGAVADRKGLLAAGAEVELARHDPLLQACRDRLLVEPVPGNLPACLGAVALARLGFASRAADRLGAWLARIGRDGRGPKGEAEDSAVLAWAASEYVRWSGDRGWLQDHLQPWRRLLDRLVKDEAEAGGRPLFGPDGSVAWTATWRAAALLGSAAVLREVEPDHARWAIAGGHLREALPGLLGEAPWSAHPDRAADGSSAGLLTAAWLGLMPIEHPGVRLTVAHIRRHHWHGGGVLLHAGTHLAATSLWAAVASRLGEDVDPVGIIAELSSPTHALPTGRHPTRGALGRGDDYLSTALFVMLALDSVRVGRRSLRFTPDLRRARDLPTPFGRVDVDTLPDGRREVRSRWWGPAPTVSTD